MLQVARYSLAIGTFPQMIADDQRLRSFHASAQITRQHGLHIGAPANALNTHWQCGRLLSDLPPHPLACSLNGFRISLFRAKRGNCLVQLGFLVTSAVHRLPLMYALKSFCSWLRVRKRVTATTACDVWNMRAISRLLKSCTYRKMNISAARPCNFGSA